MRIALIAPPFISVPPVRYGGTELFVAHLAHGLQARGHDVVVYANGDSRVGCELRWRYRHADWPVKQPMAASIKNSDHHAWAVHDASLHADVLHINDAVAVPFTPFVDQPVVKTLHHPNEPLLSDLYVKYPAIQYVAISAAQGRGEPMPNVHVIHHGLDLDQYRTSRAKDEYVVFLGRMAPCKGAHNAIAAARRAGVRLKLAGEIQPVFQTYWDQQVHPHLGGAIEYVGEADLEKKNQLLSRARALLFPIEWEEPFGLAMIEAMACGTPVLAFAGGSVTEVVRDGVSGWICRDVADMADRIAAPAIPSASCRDWVATNFSIDRMVDRYLALYDRVVSRPPLRSIADAAGPPDIVAPDAMTDRLAARTE
jgi:glycosyltransferase involved in cell wall biosynthesis